MRPRKSKELIKEVAAQTNIPENLVEDIIKFYWKEVWDTLTRAEDIKVHITNLGDFNIKHWLLDKEIERAKQFPLKTRLKGANKFAASVKMVEKVKVLQSLKDKVQEELQRKEFIVEHKKSLHEASKTNTDTDLEQ